MCDRERFEDIYPIPQGAEYSEEHGNYLYTVDNGIGLIELVGQATSVMVYCHMWSAWKAAKDAY